MKRNHRAAWWLRLATLASLLLLAFSLPACGSGALLTDVRPSSSRLAPEPDGKPGSLRLAYRLGRSALVSIELVGDDGRRYILRKDEPRTPGQYVAQLDGSYGVDAAGPERRLLPTGSYRYSLVAVDRDGERAESQGEITIEAPRVLPPEIEALVVTPAIISPNGDAKDDEAKISYTMTQDARVAVFVEDAAGGKSFIRPATQRKAAAYGLDWDGKVGGQLLPDGDYFLHIQAQDTAGNLTDQRHPLAIRNGGKSEVQITKVEFSPVAVPQGGDLHVTIKVKNTGNTVVGTLGPPPGTEYTTNMTYNFWMEDDGVTSRYYERPGVWRVAVSWNVAGSPYPVRWGLTQDLSPLAPGQEATITGTIKVLPRTPEVRFWASVEQGGVGFPGGEVGQTVVRVGY